MEIEILKIQKHISWPTIQHEPFSSAQLLSPLSPDRYNVINFLFAQQTIPVHVSVPGSPASPLGLPSSSSSPQRAITPNTILYWKISRRSLQPLSTTHQPPPLHALVVWHFDSWQPTNTSSSDFLGSWTVHTRRRILTRSGGVHLRRRATWFIRQPTSHLGVHSRGEAIMRLFALPYYHHPSTTAASPPARHLSTNSQFLGSLWSEKSIY